MRLKHLPDTAGRGHQRIQRSRSRLAVILFIVGIPLLFFAIVGLPHLFRNGQVQNIITQEGGAPPDVSSAHFASTFAMLIGTPLTAGNTVEVLTNGDATFLRLWSDLRSARRSITVQMYYAGPGAVADNVARILVERARAGVDIYVLYDAFGAQDLPQSYIDTMQAGGVHVVKFRPLRWYSLDRASHRLHVRGIVIDGEVAYTGGFGFDDEWLGGQVPQREWRETNARFVGPAVAQMQATFVANWVEATGNLLIGQRLLMPDGATEAATGNAPGRTQAAVVYSPPLEGSTSAERLIALSIVSARRRLYIANAYFVPDADFVKLLVDAARRGVDVRLLTGGAQTDVKMTRLAGRSRYEVLLAAGVRIYEYRPANMHAKTFVVDGRWTAIGTMNFDNRSLAYNNEVALVVLDVPVGATMESLFLADLRLSDEILPVVFARRSHTQRLLERVASALAGLL